jgi:hypothetical protein
MQPRNHVIHSSRTALPFSIVGVIHPVAAHCVLRPVVFFNVQHICVVDILGNFFVLELHLVNVVSDLVHSSSQSFVHFLVAVVGSNGVSDLVAGRALVVQVCDVGLDLLALVSEQVQLTVKRVADVEQVLGFDDLCVNVVQLALEMLDVCNDAVSG